MKKLLFLFSILILILSASVAFASFISLKTAFSVKSTDNALKVDLSSTNKGDESAFNVQAEIKIGSKYLIAEKKPELKVGEKYSFFEVILLPETKPGSYPAVLTLHYTDASAYPFSAVSCQTYSVKGANPSKLTLQAKNTAISKKGKLKLLIKNPENHAIKGVVSLATPKEILTGNNPRDCSIKARSQTGTFIEISNLSALAGSTYNLFWIFEYDDNGKHFSIIRPVTVKINANDGFFGIGNIFLLIVLIGLITLFLYNQFYRK